MILNELLVYAIRLNIRLQKSPLAVGYETLLKLYFWMCMPGSLKTYIIITCLAGLFILPVAAAGQTSVDPIANRGYYRTQNQFGVYLHTRGIGGYYRRGWRQTGFSNKILNVELLSMRHPKEYKVTPPGQQNIRGYYLGKINTVTMLRGSFGWQKTLFDKEVKRGVRVSYFFLFGPTIAFVKPVYVEVQHEDELGVATFISTERYDYEKHSSANVLGRAPILTKVNETKLYPGLHVKLALNFEYSPDDAMIRALETGINFDAFGKVIPIMANTYNNQFFTTVYLAFHLGKRYL